MYHLMKMSQMDTEDIHSASVVDQSSFFVSLNEMLASKPYNTSRKHTKSKNSLSHSVSQRGVWVAFVNPDLNAYSGHPVLSVICK